MSKADDVYFESIRRKDKKYNFYFVPISAIDDKEFWANGLHQDSIVFESIYINGKALKVFNFNGTLILSLKPGIYKIKIKYKVNASLSLRMYSIIRKRRNEKMTDNSFNQNLKYSGSKEITVTFGEMGDYYALFKARISTTWTSRGDDPKVWSLKDYTHSYDFNQTDLRTINSLCSTWEGYKKKYNYPTVDLEDLLNVWANS